MSITLSIDQLLKYAENHGLVSGSDIIMSRNLLLDLLKINQPATYDSGLCHDTDLESILAALLQYAYENGLIEDNTTTYRDLFESKIMGILTPRHAEVIAKFNAFSNKADAVNYFYALSKATNYIKTARIQKNLRWMHPTECGELEITINLSKPEKDPKEIAKALTATEKTYPKCLLCVENVGFAGHINHPSRQNHRIIPITLGDEDWYLQYSPYAYYNEHCIPLCGQHRPIAIHRGTFEKLLDFLQLFPQYFVGSNADLPIVGGSILNHDHFQGGRHKFPIEKAAAYAEYTLMGVKAELIKWPMSVIRLSSKHRSEIVNAATDILAKWRGYEDETVNIIPYSGKTPHNTVTPIARINSQNEYEFDLVLRNNRTNADYPDGIFHPHPHVHHIKKENIGLIEVMGLAILPGRLATQLNVTDRSGEMAYIGETFHEVLKHAGVFKSDSSGMEAFHRFLKTCGTP